MFVDQFLLTSECRGGLPCPDALGALSAELIFAQAVLKEIGPSFLMHARADISTARKWQRNKEQVASKLQDETHSHEILIHSRFGVSARLMNRVTSERKRWDST